MANRDKILKSFKAMYKTPKMRGAEGVEGKGKKRRDFRKEMSDRKWEVRLGKDDE